MTSLFWTLGLLFLCSRLTLQVILLPHERTFKGAAFEYDRDLMTERKMNPNEVIAENARRAAIFMSKAQEYGVDIITLPERGLLSQVSLHVTEDATYIPDPKDKIVPCNDTTTKYSESLQILSCAAKNTKMYVLANYKEKEDCPQINCTKSGLEIYQTSVVLNRIGEVIVRQRIPLDNKDPKRAKVDHILFNPDFNVTFGEFFCFDVNYKTYDHWLKRQFNTSNVFVGSKWFTELPSTEHPGNNSWWSSSNNINIQSEIYSEQCYDALSLQRPNASRNEFNITGLGSYGRTFMNDHRLAISSIFSENQILIIDSKHLHALHKSNLQLHVSDIVNQTMREYTRTLCYQDTCCHFNITHDIQQSLVQNSTTDYYRYYVSIINGSQIFEENKETKGSVCGILPCLNSSLKSCGYEFNSNITNVLPSIIRVVNVTITTNSAHYSYVSALDLPPHFQNPLVDVRNFRYVKNEGETWISPYLRAVHDSARVKKTEHVPVPPEVTNSKTESANVSGAFYFTFGFAAASILATAILIIIRYRNRCTHPYISFNSESHGTLLKDVNQEGRYV